MLNFFFEKKLFATIRKLERRAFYDMAMFEMNCSGWEGILQCVNHAVRNYVTPNLKVYVCSVEQVQVFVFQLTKITQI